MRRAVLLICILLSLPVFSADRSTNAALQRLDGILQNQEKFLAVRQQRIDSLRELYSAQPGPALLMQISEAYKGFNNDSAMAYLRLGAETTSGREADGFRWRLAALMPLGGLFDQAIKTFQNIDTTKIEPRNLASYYDSGRQMYSYIGAFLKDYPTTSQEYSDKALEMQRRLLDVLPPHSLEHRFNLGEYFYLTGSNEKAKILLEEVVESEPAWSNMSARASNHLYNIYKESGEQSTAIYYLTLSAISDILSATREVASLQTLGNVVYESGDIGRAYSYLSAALEKAVTCGAPLRMVETAKGLPIIEHAHSSRMAANRRALNWVVAGVWVLLIIVLVTLFTLKREMSKMARLQESLRLANNAKEVYISQFLSLCSIYMDKLNQFCKLVTRKLAAGQSDELYRMAKSGKFIEEQTGEFYEVFDDAFLHIYPNFVEQVNGLLRPECRITLQSGEMLNTDLRILAFMRLGIEESPRIAQVLNYSLNTIYAYRNRLKSRAINRETFEADVMSINSQA